MKKRILKAWSIILLFSVLLSSQAWAVELPDLGELASEVASEIADAAENAGDILTDLGKQAGETAHSVKEELSENYRKLQKYGSFLVNIARAIVSGFDLADEKTWEKARSAVDGAVDLAYRFGILDRDQVSEETVRTVTRILFSALRLFFVAVAGEPVTG